MTHSHMISISAHWKHPESARPPFRPLRADPGQQRPREAADGCRVGGAREEGGAVSMRNRRKEKKKHRPPRVDAHQQTVYRLRDLDVSGVVESMDVEAKGSAVEHPQQTPANPESNSSRYPFHLGSGVHPQLELVKKSIQLRSLDYS